MAVLDHPFIVKLVSRDRFMNANFRCVVCDVTMYSTSPFMQVSHWKDEDKLYMLLKMYQGELIYL